MSLVIHVVLISYRLGADADAIRESQEALSRLPAKIPVIGRYLGGPNASPEGLGQGYDWGFVMTFGDAASRDEYLAHSAHTAVHPLLDAVADNVLVYDIEG